jgi:isopenicillin N synthase-like dioxygenase
VHCPQHSDIGLVTVIPTARGGAGLNKFDWQSACWFDVETSAPPNVAVVFTGESMAAASSVTQVRPERLCLTELLAQISACVRLQSFVPTMHEVARIDSLRYSMAFQLLARGDARLDPSSDETAKEFVHHVSVSDLKQLCEAARL